MTDGIVLKRGDKCPVDGGELKPARVPTEEQRRRAEDRETRDALPPDMDTASEKQRRELGELFRCQSCGYMTRFPLEPNAQRPGASSSSRGGQPAGGSRSRPSSPPSGGEPQGSADQDDRDNASETHQGG